VGETHPHKNKIGDTSTGMSDTDRICEILGEAKRLAQEYHRLTGKPLEQPIELGVRWELRLGPSNRFRVFYRVDAEQRQVRVLAIGVKVRNRLFIAGEEVKL
jgi:hypothetical protein